MTTYLDRTVFLNGEYVLARDAKISIFDRGLLFADAVYEGLGLLDGNILDFDLHMVRLDRSLAELGIVLPLSHSEIYQVFTRLVTDNALTNGFLYLQITRGVADRRYLPAAGLVPTVFAFTQPGQPIAERETQHGIRMTSCPDLRWKRRDIKTTNLLGQVMAKQVANAANTAEALLVDDAGYITEAASKSFFIIQGHTISTPPVSSAILHGVTRQAMLQVAAKLGLQVSFRKFTPAEAYAADEAFVTGSSATIVPVIAIDEQLIGAGKPGAITQQLQREYLAAFTAAE